MLARIGIRVQLQSQPMTQLANLLSTTGADFYLWGWAPGNFDITNPLRELLSTQNGGGSNNFGRYSNPRLEELRGLIAGEPDPERRMALAHEALAIFQADVPIIPLHQEPQVFGVRDSVASFEMRAGEDVDLRFVRMR
jgi:peptide/nickel transport system substrate-binding protein